MDGVTALGGDPGVAGEGAAQDVAAARIFQVTQQVEDNQGALATQADALLDVGTGEPAKNRAKLTVVLAYMDEQVQSGEWRELWDLQADDRNRFKKIYPDDDRLQILVNIAQSADGLAGVKDVLRDQRLEKFVPVAHEIMAVAQRPGGGVTSTYDKDLKNAAGHLSAKKRNALAHMVFGNGDSAPTPTPASSCGGSGVPEDPDSNKRPHEADAGRNKFFSDVRGRGHCRPQWKKLVESDEWKEFEGNYTNDEELGEFVQSLEEADNDATRYGQLEASMGGHANSLASQLLKMLRGSFAPGVQDLVQNVELPTTEYTTDAHYQNLPEVGHACTLPNLGHWPQRMKLNQKFIVTQEMHTVGRGILNFLNNHGSSHDRYYVLFDGSNGMGKSVTGYMTVVYLNANGVKTIYIPQSDVWAMGSGEASYVTYFFEEVAVSLAHVLDAPTTADSAITWRALISEGLRNPTGGCAKKFLEQYFHKEPKRAVVVDRQNVPYRMKKENKLTDFPDCLWYLLDFTEKQQVRQGLAHVIIASANSEYTQNQRVQVHMQEIIYCEPLSVDGAAEVYKSLCPEMSDDDTLSDDDKKKIHEEETGGVPEMVRVFAESGEDLPSRFRHFRRKALDFWRSKFDTPTNYSGYRQRISDHDRLRCDRALLNFFNGGTEQDRSFQVDVEVMDCGLLKRDKDTGLCRPLAPIVTEYLLEFTLKNLWGTDEGHLAAVNRLADLEFLKTIPENPRGSEHGWRWQGYVDALLGKPSGITKQYHACLSGSDNETELLTFNVRRIRQVPEIPSSVQPGVYYIMRPDYPAIDAFLVTDTGLILFFQHTCAWDPWGTGGKSARRVFQTHDKAKLGGETIATAVERAYRGDNTATLVSDELGAITRSRARALTVAAEEGNLGSYHVLYVLVTPYSHRCSSPEPDVPYCAVMGAKSGLADQRVIAAFEVVATENKRKRKPKHATY